MNQNKILTSLHYILYINTYITYLQNIKKNKQIYKIFINYITYHITISIYTISKLIFKKI